MRALSPGESVRGSKLWAQLFRCNAVSLTGPLLLRVIIQSEDLLFFTQNLKTFREEHLALEKMKEVLLTLCHGSLGTFVL